ncbi:PIH1 domain-containing protein 1 isoform X2 [Betta splendens]|uniref:PIH1 domain-containing protein 1 n=1 Tax=Betta splendens TaxID=158456 RepID=A0A6P7N7D4_BETSP|nr:PIH1 domain-containing protein 1 isoform X2 [Betta splendens]
MCWYLLDSMGRLHQLYHIMSNENISLPRKTKILFCTGQCNFSCEVSFYLLDTHQLCLSCPLCVLGSQGCTAYDVVINQEFFQKCQEELLFQQFVILVSFEGLENKYKLELSRDWKVLKNRKFLGSVSEQNIRTKSKPVIQELQPQESSTASAKRPEFLLLVEPSSGNPEYLIAEIKLPGVLSSRSLVLDVGEDHLILTARPSLFHLDTFHAFLINQENSVAQFNKSTQILTVIMPIVSS